MTRKWFGTDGIRGAANVDLTAELALRVGRAAVSVLAGEHGGRLLVGRDTRVSGYMLEAALAAGVASAGGRAVLAGVVPTPAVSRLVAAGEFDGGVVISASHNPFRDNGIKLFGQAGKKLSDEVEARVETLMEQASAADDVGEVQRMPGAGALYVEDLLGALDVDLSGLRVLLDCANGAAYQVAPLAFMQAGATVETICAAPDGVNINAGCGSTHLGTIAGHVVQGDFDLGLAFDGDADRVLAVDHTGAVVDGDQILALLAPWMKQRGRLVNDTVVVTSMSNLGFHKAMSEAGIRVEVTDVGDRYVLERMEQVPAVLGGEQSGHVIALDLGSTGDGLQTGLMLCRAVLDSGRTFSDLAKTMRRFPQLLVNVRVGDKGRLGDAQQVWDAVREEEEALGGEGRVVLRPSGTEPLVRVMVEAPDEERCRLVADRLIATVERALA